MMGYVSTLMRIQSAFENAGIRNMPIEKIERIAANRMDDRHVHLNALMND